LLAVILAQATAAPMSFLDAESRDWGTELKLDRWAVVVNNIIDNIFDNVIASAANRAILTSPVDFDFHVFQC
jgi:hypothetical protein